MTVEITWAQPDYFKHFFPAFLLYAAYEMVVRALRVRPLASYLVVIATK